MALTLEQVVKQLEDSGIIASETLKDFIPPKADPKTPEELVQALVKSDKLDALPGPSTSMRENKIADPVAKLH